MPINFGQQMLAVVLPWLVLAGVAVSLIFAFRLFVWPRLKGRLGEAGVNIWVKKMLDPGVYHLIADVMLPTSDGTTQIDHVIVSRYGIFVIET